LGAVITPGPPSARGIFSGSATRSPPPTQRFRAQSRRQVSLDHVVRPIADLTFIRTTASWSLPTLPTIPTRLCPSGPVRQAGARLLADAKNGREILSAALFYLRMARACEPGPVLDLEPYSLAASSVIAILMK
jgi:hypothetical protein